MNDENNSINITCDVNSNDSLNIYHDMSSSEEYHADFLKVDMIITDNHVGSVIVHYEDAIKLRDFLIEKLR